jgi:dTDP-4-dehydrorhamnose reductase
MRILLTGTTGQVGRALLGPLQSIGTVIPVPRADFDLSDPGRLRESWTDLRRTSSLISLRRELDGNVLG